MVTLQDDHDLVVVWSSGIHKLSVGGLSLGQITLDEELVFDQLSSDRLYIYFVCQQ